MTRRLVLLLTAIVFLLLGGVGAYLLASVPNDVRSEAMLRDAREKLKKQEREKAREGFESIIRDFPRTDAAAAATWALFRMQQEDRRALERHIGRLEKELAVLRTRSEADRKTLEQLQKAAVEAATKAAAPVLKKAAPKPPARKPARRTTRRRR